MELKHEDTFFSKDFDGFVELFENEMTFDDSISETEKHKLTAGYAQAYELGLIHNDLVNFLKLLMDERQNQIDQAEKFRKQMEQGQNGFSRQSKDFENRYKAAGLDKQAEALRKQAKKYSDTLSDLTKKLQKEAEDSLKRQAQKNNLTVLSKDGDPIGEVKEENTNKPADEENSASSGGEKE